MVEVSTSAESLLTNPKFVEYAQRHVPSNILNEYAPDRSDRWIRRVAARARELTNSNIIQVHTLQDRLEKPYRELEFSMNKDGPLSAKVDSVEYIGNLPPWTFPFREHEGDPKRHRVPDCTERSTQQWMKLTGDYAIVSDLHIPFYHAPTLERLMDDAEKVGIKDLIIAGDLYDFNMFHHGPRGAAHQRRGQDDIELGRGILKGLLKYFSTIKIFMGNHDNYLAKDLRNHFDSDFLFTKFFSEFSDRIQWSSYSHCDVTSGGVFWKIIHGAAFSETNSVGVAKRYAEKFGANVIVGHQHRVEEAHGKYHAYCIGGAHDATKMGYLNFDPTPNAIPKRSYGILKDGWFEHIYRELN